MPADWKTSLLALRAKVADGADSRAYSHDAGEYAQLAMLRSAAPASPALAGAAAGLLAAASGAALYAFHCFDDSPLFVVTWYTLAALVVMAIGALAGRRLLRW